jgi:diguanylate cyclase
MNLDLTTLTLVMAALTLSSTLVLWLIWLINRQMPGVLMWTIASLLSIGSVIANLFASMQFISPEMGAWLSNCFSLSSGILILEGTLRFRFGVSENRWLAVMLLIPLFMLMSWINRFDAVARYIFHDGFMLSFALVSAGAMVWRVADVQELRANMMATAGQLMMALAMGGRLSAALFNPESVNTGLSSAATQWFLFAAILFYINWTLGLSVACYSRSHREVMQLAREDDLTGLPNRRSLDERLQQSLADARRSNDEFAVIMMDVDCFKRVNDELGHRAGDQLLQILAQRLRQALREVDYAGRLSGDEFLVIVRGKNAVGSLETLMNRLQDMLGGRIELQDGRINVSLSMGMAQWPQDSDTIDGLLRVADARMYQHKYLTRRSELDEEAVLL